jgi:hypothetical protein
MRRIWCAAVFSAALAGLGCVAQAPEPATRERMQAVFADRGSFRLQLEAECKNVEQVDQIIGEAIEIGAPIYNAGSALGCFRIYEGAAYKLLVTQGAECPELAAFVRGGLMQVDAAGNESDKAWALRQMFDAIGGQSTRFQR